MCPNATQNCSRTENFGSSGQRKSARDSPCQSPLSDSSKRLLAPQTEEGAEEEAEGCSFCLLQVSSSDLLAGTALRLSAPGPKVCHSHSRNCEELRTPDAPIHSEMVRESRGFLDPCVVRLVPSSAAIGGTRLAFRLRLRQCARG